MSENAAETRIEPPDEAMGTDIPHHVSARKQRGLPEARYQLNLTSMIDVIFQLLIYFVVTASFTIDEGVLTAKLPEEGISQKQTTPEPPERPVGIVIESHGLADFRLRVEGYPELPANSFSALSMLMKQNATNNTWDPEKKPVVIKPDGQVRWQHVVNAFNAATAARYKNVSFAQASPKG